MSAAEWNQALTACRPRLAAEISATIPASEATPPKPVVLALGAKSLRALSGKPPNIFDWQGAFLPGVSWREDGRVFKPTKKEAKAIQEVGSPGVVLYDFSPISCIASIHPAFCLPHRSPQYTPVLLTFVKRAVAMARGQLTPWQWPKIVISETSSEDDLVSALKDLQVAPSVAIDVETAGKDPLAAPLLNVGFASVNPPIAASVYWPGASARIKAETTRICADPSIAKDFWNRPFDVLSLRTHGLEVRGRQDDWILAHQIFAPRLSHKLSDAASFEFPAPRWKTVFRQTSDHGGADRFTKADPVERAIYNAQDCVVTAAFREVAEARLPEVHRGRERYEKLLELTDAAMEMRVAGIATSQPHVLAHKEPLELQRQAALARVGEIAARLGVPDYAPASFPQTSKLFLDTLRAPPRYSKDGRITFDEKVLQDYCTLGGPVSDLSRAILQARKAKKSLDYLGALVGRERVHPSWSPGRAKTGRWGSQWPNLMNIPKDKVAKDGTVKVRGLRNCFRAAEGMYLVEADYSALESRIVAIVSGDKTLLDWHNANLDVHRKTAALMFSLLEEAVGSDLREQAKTTRYAFQYGAAEETAWRNAVVDFPKLTLTGMKTLFKCLRQLHPGVIAYHKRALKQAREDDFVEEPFGGLRFYFHGNVDQNQVYNLPIQSFGAELINRALIRIRRRLQGLAGLVARILLQIHDSLVLETSDPGHVIPIVREEMEREVELHGQRMCFPVDVKVGENWGEMQKWKG